MAGILPMAIHNQKTYFLFGRERRYPKYRDSCKWSDFGGAPDKGETIKETAIRECYEETSGLLGTLSEIRSCLENNYVTCINTDRYKTFIMKIKYDETLPQQFEDIYNDVYTNNPESLLKHDGKNEKDMAKWVELKDLKEFSNQARFFYKKIIYDIILYFKYFKSNHKL
jgi:8-oxo-dGTP pyrophosphatase MutT (NUDIX family)